MNRLKFICSPFQVKHEGAGILLIPYAIIWERVRQGVVLQDNKGTR